MLSRNPATSIPLKDISGLKGLNLSAYILRKSDEEQLGSRSEVELTQTSE